MIISLQISYRSFSGSRLWDHTMSTMEKILTLNKWSYIFKLHCFYAFSPIRIKLWWAPILQSIHYSVNTNDLNTHNQRSFLSSLSITSYHLYQIISLFYSTGEASPEWDYNCHYLSNFNMQTKLMIYSFPGTWL